MSDETQSNGPVASNGGTDELNELIAELVQVDLEASSQQEGSQLSAKYRANLQGLVTTAMSNDGTEPDVHSLITAALDSWADDK